MAEPDAPAPWERTPPGRRTRVFRTFTGLVFLCSLGVAIATWIAMSRPFDPGQRSALTVRLDPGTARAAAELPRSPGSIIALTYHEVDDHDGAGGTLSRRLFGEHMAALAAAGYRTVRLRDVEDLLAHRPVRLPPRALLLTFDDGQLTDWTTADPVLKKYGFTATSFLTTGRIVAPGTPSHYLSTAQVRALAATGRWEFGSHGHAMHTAAAVPGDIAPPLPNRVLVNGAAEPIERWRARVQADLARSRSFFRRTLGHDVTAFSYPFGATGRAGNDPRIRDELPELIRRAGFGEAFAGENVPAGHVDAVTGAAPRWELPRIGVRATTSVADLLEMIRGAVPAPPPRDLSTLPWAGDLATCRRRGSHLAVTSDEYGSCLLSGVNTAGWTDYRVSTSVSGLDARTSAVIAVRDGAGAGHRGRAEIVIGAAAVVVRRQVGEAPAVVVRRVRLAPR
ncbi:polysaccharide deacetylase family protein, partial [Actinomadura roseirufa]|uniref:polysaccharide deacetylase family protein n=1 Tax=Actinomadura roseirufa TaxID=2094049 RepID=UPI001041110E